MCSMNLPKKCLNKLNRLWSLGSLYSSLSLVCLYSSIGKRMQHHIAPNMCRHNLMLHDERRKNHKMTQKREGEK